MTGKDKENDLGTREKPRSSLIQPRKINVTRPKSGTRIKAL